MSVKETLNLLSICEIFAGLTERQKLYITPLFKTDEFAGGTVVLREGQIVRDLYIIAQGEWEVFLPKRDSDELARYEDIRLSVLGRGDLLGEYSFIDHRAASASVRSLEQGKLLIITRENFQRIVDSSNQVGKVIYKNLLQALIARLRDQNEEKDLMNLLDF